jgi:hypothetical protein
MTNCTDSRRRRQWVYDDKQVVAVIEQIKDGWRVIKHGREIGVFKRRQDALAAAMNEQPD